MGRPTDGLPEMLGWGIQVICAVNQKNRLHSWILKFTITLVDWFCNVSVLCYGFVHAFPKYHYLQYTALVRVSRSRIPYSFTRGSTMLAYFQVHNLKSTSCASMHGVPPKWLTESRKANTLSLWCHQFATKRTKHLRAVHGFREVTRDN